MLYAEVILSINNKNVDRVFHYKVPFDMEKTIKIGMLSFVPFGKNNAIRKGYVIGLLDDVDIDKTLIKEIKSLPNSYPIFSENMIELAKFMSYKYYSTMSECLQCIMPKIVKNKEARYVYINYEKENIHEYLEKIIKKNNSQSKILKFLEINDGFSVMEIKSLLDVSISPINTLEKNEIIKIKVKKIKRDAFDINNYKKTCDLLLNKQQQNAFDFIKNKMDKKNKKPIVLHGVTGSGKTEIYLQLIKDVVDRGKQAIMLVPEISLTPQTIERFIGRFGNKVGITHSRLSFGERFDQWKKAQDNDISIMVGARSAIFTPFEDVGIIIIDEEHELTYKSESTPKYDAKDVAKKICELNGATLILGSATPCIETYYNAKNGIYDIVCMEKRVNDCMPDVSIVDMRKELENGNMSMLSDALFEAIRQNFENNMQTILFLNRRGHSTFISCRKCGYTMECERCNVNYTYHINDNKLMCHYCNATSPIPSICPKCSSTYIKYFGAGTQKIEEYIKKNFKNMKILRMDFDTTSKKGGHQYILEKFKNNEADMLIGTQMIAKGLDFERVSLVGVISADLSLNTGDYRSSEACFQILTQVSGRAGRASFKGKVFIQTYTPNHFSIQCAKNNDYLAFYEKEIQNRKDMFYPPFSNIFFIMISGKNEKNVKKSILFLHSILKYYNKKTNFYLSDVAKAYIYKMKNNYRYKIVIKAEDEDRLKNFVMYCVDILKRKIDTKDIHIVLSLNPSYMQ